MKTDSEPIETQFSSDVTSSETQGQIAEARVSLNGQKKMATKKSIVVVILNSVWCQKFFVFFCPIRGQHTVKSFRVFLHRNHLIAILAWFVWQGFARGEKSQSQHKMYRKSFGKIGGEIRWTFRRYRYGSFFPGRGISRFLS